ncbi:hypothetical protein KMZ29_07575 [Bradyrhizobium sediminis]|uniref:Uncharacterized protein n=1 Tax=Bradyrhizobium sediminis TaxID=2840469 RepID=A0A975NH94_9BRAD|nr:hypothetical protein [Bradyrhizobium sediminis]QWG14516.1 hypothetical protein KMZ29_07575 [Bradyrhizobium sediminis]
MQDRLETFSRGVNFTRYRGQPEGHYESFFVRANHPHRAQAFWIRYTIFSPKGRPDDAIGEIWAIFFDAELNRHAVAKQEYRLADCDFDASSFRVRVGKATLLPNRLEGAIEGTQHSLAWNLKFEGDSPPALLLPLAFYERRFPAAKSVVSLPMARFSGVLTVDGKQIEIADWVGSQNHNWGSRHTDLYAWGQVAGFDNQPDSFLEVATARLRLGPFWTPPITPMVLRHKQREYAFTGLGQAIRARGKFGYFSWQFASRNRDAEIAATISAPREAFVGLRYYNPPGGVKHCLNSKIARCTLRLTDRRAGTTEVLETKNRAAFEILTDDETHGVEMSA